MKQNGFVQHAANPVPPSITSSAAGGQCAIGLLLLLTCVRCFAGEWSGSAGAELRLFPEDAAFSAQDHHSNLSLVIEPEYYRQWDGGDQSLSFSPFLRLDQHDDQRTHFDIRELSWLKVTDDWELRLGIRQLFWGVTESQHLVDIVNQTDFVEDIDDEDKLGQPMLNLSFARPWGILDLFVLPGFRERTFPGRDGRLRFSLPVDTDRPIYESGAEERHVDAAVRWFRTLGDLDIGLYHFYGTSRDPLLIPTLDNDGTLVLRPRYDLINQTGLDLQLTGANTLWKAEAITRNGQGDRYFAFTGGFEYTFVGIGDSSADLGVLFEYLFDDRGESAPTPFDDDLFFGLRLGLNDVSSSELLVGTIIDRETGARLTNVEGSRRLAPDYRLSLIGRFFSDVPNEDQSLYGMRRDSFISLQLTRYF
ncbi:hypothetical protein GCM10011348_26900 [Marinobacterium nitratireducens]|uniref:Uncharacterized protein n=1 Tax=Marinobacterium nitratireducens TaxID=518897 RepID=A0A917ZI05_9GAMM|nr:hypothetical protein [Marinobacterium nitratireducens]GGO83346.1 hypothetical protein GCM10011348_26900 [Marinobacterium nitratireducens]